MDVWRTIFGWWEEGVEELKNEISVGEGKLSVNHGFHGIRKQGDVFRLLVNAFDNV